MPVFTPHQDAALSAASNWLKAARGRSSIFRLFGYAGTGKTTLVKHIAEGVDGKVLFAAFTGKAACVMRSKGCYSASTIHSLIYKARESGEETPSFELWNDAPASKAKLIVIDECSMVDAELARDLMSFGVPLLVLGDPAQLPPIQGGGFFTDAKPDAMLTEVHRQAQDDPIVRLSMEIRAGNPLTQGQYGETQVVRRDALDPKRVLDADQVLVGRNVTRRAYNARLRERRGFADALPMAGDKLVCLRNNRRKGLFNGGLWMVKESPKARRQIIRMRLKPDEDLGDKADQGIGSAGMLYRRHRGVRLAAAQSLRRVRLRLRVDRAQGARLAVGRRGAVRRIRCVPRQSRSLALYRRDTGREAADRSWCGVPNQPRRTQAGRSPLPLAEADSMPSCASLSSPRPRAPASPGIRPPRRRANVSSPLCSHWPATARSA